MTLLKQQNERTNKRQKFIPLKPLSFCQVFGARAFTPLVPLYPSPQTEKQNRFFLVRAIRFQRIKEKHVHHITAAYTVRPFLRKSLSQLDRWYAFGILYQRSSSHMQRTLAEIHALPAQKSSIFVYAQTLSEISFLHILQKILRVIKPILRERSNIR